MNIQPVQKFRRVLVMGLGLFGGGVGAARFWLRMGAEVTVTDLRDSDTLAPSLRELQGTPCRFVLGEHRDEDFKQADLLVVNPAVKPDNRYVNLARQAGAVITTEIGMLLRLASGPVLAVTGSNGKSTTTSLLGAMLQAHSEHTLVGGNIGGSLLEAMETHLPSGPIVLELSSFQLHYLRQQSFAPHVAVVTNLAPNHLDWHRTVLHYYESKRVLLQSQQPEDTAVLNAEDETLRAWANDCRARVILTAPDDPGTRNACFVRAAPEPCIVLRDYGDEVELAPLSLLRLPGRHNVQNALQAAAAAYAQTRDIGCIRAGLEAFGGLPHRLEEVAELNGVRFINDSIATTPESAICALEAFSCPRVLIAGGYDKGVDFAALGKAIVAQAEAVVLVGETARAIREAIEAASSATKPVPTLVDAGVDFTLAVQKAFSLCPSGGVVLLSPACASYGMFTHFQERGERFRAIAHEMSGTGQTIE